MISPVRGAAGGRERTAADMAGRSPEESLEPPLETINREGRVRSGNTSPSVYGFAYNSSRPAINSGV